MKKKIIFITISIFLVILILFSSTYALLFKTDETDKQSYTTGILSITSEAVGNSVTLNNSLPMSDSDGENSTPYIFRITNTGNLSYKFNVMLLSTTTDNQIGSEYLKLKVNDNTIVKLNSLTNGVILSNITLKPTEYIDVTLRVWLDINTPNTEIGKTFNAKITTEGQAVYTESPAKETLTMLGLTESTGTPDFSKTSCSSGCGESTVGIYKTKDDIGDSYYFRGDVENNYVYFANKYWRIIRINGDGSVRMIYAGTSAHENGYDDSSTNDMSIGTSAFNTNYNDNAYVGFMYGTTGASDYATTHANTNDSTIKKALDTWYTNNIKNTDYEQYIADAIYCNDREISTANIAYLGDGAGNNLTAYKAEERGFLNEIPSLKCNQVNDRFTVNLKVSGVTGNGALTNPIGLITADEVGYAGGLKYIGESANNTKYYLYTNYWYWTMSPDKFDGGLAYVFLLTRQGSFDISANGVRPDYGVRPVISLSSGALSSGTGTKDDPFKINHAKNTLTQLGLTENDTVLTTFTNTSKNDGTTGIYKAEDDLGESYYFRGNVTNNYVKFAGYYWRIIRINGDGSIRMIYDGTSAHANNEASTDRQIGTSAYNTNSNDNAYVGYMFGTAGSSTYEATHANTNDSTIKTYLDNWYNNNIKGTTDEQYVADAIYCNDRTRVTDSTQMSALNSSFGLTATGEGYGTKVTYYGFLNRTAGDNSSITPSLKCEQLDDKFTKSSSLGNGKLDNPIGLITLDEMVYAGSYLYMDETSVNDETYLYNGSNWYWSMSPFDFRDGYADVGYGYLGAIFSDSVNGNDGAVRAVISLSSGALKYGNGTSINPYRVNSSM